MQKDLETELPSNIYSVAQVRAMDRAAIDDEGISGYTLMTRAARAALDDTVARFPAASRWQIVCGGGNNAGDGYVLARLAAHQGISVSVLSLVDPETLGGDALIAFNDFSAEGGSLALWQGALDDEADLIVDSLLGSGLDRPLAGAFLDAVSSINKHAGQVIALDIPTGIHGDSGAVMGEAVKADMTVTFVGLKSGLFLGEASQHVGELCFADLEIPAVCRSGISAGMRRTTSNLVRKSLPVRRRDAHKGNFGHVVVVGGGPGMLGAVRLAGEAALRSGAGRVSIATHPSHHGGGVNGRPELMCHAIGAPQDLEPLLSDDAIVAFGPGLGRGDWAATLFDDLLERDLRLVMDADALNLLAERPRKRDDWILTPHPGEAARLLGETSASVQDNRLGAVKRLHEKYGGAVVLKGSGTLISSDSDPVWICTAGNPGMAAAGMGDVLTGIIAALLAQGIPLEQAAIVGVEIHARAGDSAARAGERGMLASDLMQELRQWVNP